MEDHNHENHDHSAHDHPQGSQNAGGKSNILPIVLVLAALLIGGAFLYSRQSANKPSSVDNAFPAPGNEQVDEMVVNENGEAKEFSLESSNFKFDVTQMNVKVGDTVTITLVNKEGMHDFVIDEFNVRTPVVENAGEETVTFIADKAGTFEYYCSVGKHRQMGMVGKLVVE